MNLINKRLLAQRIEGFEFPTGDKQINAKKLIDGWQKALKDSDLDKTKEKSVQGKFLQTFFEDILGYTDITSGQSEWTLIQHPRIENDSMEPDGSLGWFTKEQKLTRAVIELKDAQTPLDKKQSSRAGKLTPIEQAHQYSTKYDGCKWIIVSNFKEIRLFNKQKSQEYFEKFDVLDLNNDTEFKRFYYLLCKENLISKDRESVTDLLAKDTTEAEQDITKKFYAGFKQIRLRLLDHLVNNNLEISKDILLEKTQKLLDRFIFTLFCEDTSNLLPLHIVKDTYERAINSLSPSDERVWLEFKGLFLAIDKGNERVKPPINAYNGGLFAYDSILDNLHIKDEFWFELMQLANYDFETDLNVNILGHIFEQSISDLEEIKESINLAIEDGNNLLTEDGNDIVLEQSSVSFVEKKGKRKKMGIFYTPEYITRYIVENTVGKYIEEHPDKLETIKILDPACGSGSMLNQAHSFLRLQWNIAYQEGRVKSKDADLGGLFVYNPIENDRSILLNNLYGVDLNNESVEITKLALWLKTARNSEPLQNLDKNIKSGNSLVDNPEVAGDKAFNWNTEFKETMESGGFDVIIGNPPYVFGRGNFSEIEKNFYNSNYRTAEYQINTFVVFIEKALTLLKNGGFLGFIVPNSILKLSSISKLRKFILENSKICQIVNLQGSSFEGVGVETVIIVLQKSFRTQEVQVLNISSQEDISKNNFVLCDGSKWIEKENYDFDIFLSKDDLNILDNITGNSIALGKKFVVKAGLKAYEKGKGEPKQTEIDVKNRPYDFFEKKNVDTFPYLDGKNVDRYLITPFNTWLQYGSNLAAPRSFDIFSQPRVLVREITAQTSRAFFAVYTDTIYLNNLSIINILSPDNDSSSLKYLLSILNSSLASYIFIKTNPKANRSMFPKVILEDLKKLPIAKASQAQKQSLADKAQKLLELNKELYEDTEKALEIFASKYSPKSVSANLKAFYKLGWNELIDELEKQKVKLSLSDQEELQQWFDKKRSELLTIFNEIKTLDKETDLEIYKLYKLTDEEIRIIEDSIV